MNAVVTNSMHDRVELNHILHQSGLGSDHNFSTRESHWNHGGGELVFVMRLSVTIDQARHKIWYQDLTEHPTRQWWKQASLEL